MNKRNKTKRKIKQLAFTPQKDQMDYGPACVKMIAHIFGKSYALEYLKENAFINKEGVSLLGINEVSKKIGFETLSVKLTLEKLLIQSKKLPCILHWNKNHFVVLHKITFSLFSNKIIFQIADPAYGIVKLTQDKFEKSWLSHQNKGVALFLNPTDEFYKKEPPQEEKLTIKYLFSYLKPYKVKLILMFVLLLLGSILTLVFPFLTEALVDEGVSTKNIDFVFIILLAQLSLFLGSVVINIFRNWLTLYIGTHLSITIISDFLKKILSLPIQFFDTKLMGDFQQRINDNDRIEYFLTSQSLTTFFSIITFSVFFGVLWYYDTTILLVYFILTILSVTWSFFWLKKRKVLDYFRFQQRSKNQESFYEILNGVTELKLNQLENYKVKQWENIQKKIFRVNTRILKIDQVQISGFEFLNQFKNIIVTFLAATYVIQDIMSLGMLLSISYIVGQMNSPVNQLISFLQSLQDAKLSLERLNEVQNRQTEENQESIALFNQSNCKLNRIKKDISIKNLSFQYGSSQSLFVLKDINLYIPEGKVTAIVGASGSGKTTLMKLLLRFYEPVNGKIFYNNSNILTLSPKNIRENIGTVMQDGYVFSDTIRRNIATKDEKIDSIKFQRAIEVANMKEFVKHLPLKYDTKVGLAGNSLSGGQRQRILIARAVYKDPHYIFFDEATSALDTANEKIIHDKLQEFFKEKTVLIIAHRLSTVISADNIVVLKKGKVVEQGTHEELVKKKLEYYNLIKNQLELEN